MIIRTILGFLGERALFHRVTGGMFGTPPLSQNEKSVLRLMLKSDKSGIGDVKELLNEADLTFDFSEEDKEENEEALKRILLSSKKKTRWFNENDQKCVRTLLMISNRLGHYRDVIVEHVLPFVICRKLWGIGWFDSRLSKKKRKRDHEEMKEERERARQRRRHARHESEDNDDDDDFGMRSGVITMTEENGDVHTEKFFLDFSVNLFNHHGLTITRQTSDENRVELTRFSDGLDIIVVTELYVTFHLRRNVRFSFGFRKLNHV